VSAVIDAERFVPSGNSSRYNPPRAWIDRDQSKSWLRRALRIVLARKKTLFSALGLSFLSLLLQVQIPNLLNSAVNNSLQHHHTPLGHYVRIVFVLAVAAGVSSYFARLFLMRTAYGIEADLRNMIYTHLTRMSFDFYDRVSNPAS
jgi:ATP-binding cassette subfamily B protein